MPEINPTSKELNKFIQNRSFIVYVCIGKESDLAWEVATAAEGLIPKVRAYLISPANRSQLDDWLKDDHTSVAICFKWQDEVAKTFTKDEAENLLLVAQAIQQAM